MQAINRIPRKDSKVGYQGIAYCPAGVNRRKYSKYHATITVNGKHISIGYFDHLIDAIKLRYLSEKKYGYNHDSRVSMLARYHGWNEIDISKISKINKILTDYHNLSKENLSSNITPITLTNISGDVLIFKSMADVNKYFGVNAHLGRKLNTGKYFSKQSKLSGWKADSVEE